MEKETLPKGKIVIYTSADGKISLDTKLENETIWLTQNMMAKLFETTPQNITMHIKNIYDDEELEQNSTCKDFLQVRNEGKRTVSRKLTHYNLDMILSVGYRIKSKTAVQFRKWATNILKEYLIKGYAINQEAIKEQQEKFTSLQQVIELLNRSMKNQIEAVEQAQSVSKILHQYVTGLNLLDDFDHKRLDAQGITKRKAIQISVDEFLDVIDKMKGDFASDVFAQPKDESFSSSINQIYQTFDGNELYPTLEEKAATLLYLIVKNHSFLDGNKRIGASCFLYFMDKNGLLYDDLGCAIVDDATLFALTLLMAESKPEEMDTIKKVAVSILNRNKR